MAFESRQDVRAALEGVPKRAEESTEGAQTEQKRERKLVAHKCCEALSKKMDE